MLSTKPEVHNVSLRRQRRNERRSTFGGVAIRYVLPVFLDDVMFSVNGPRELMILCRIRLGVFVEDY